MYNICLPNTEGRSDSPTSMQHAEALISVSLSCSVFIRAGKGILMTVCIRDTRFSRSFSSCPSEWNTDIGGLELCY